jgi:hypothetical protein
MSDFDAVLERLLTEPPFAAALAADPDLALAGYRLDDGEAQLLRSQVAGDTAADVAKVETRTNKSSTFGLLAPFAAMGGLVDSFGQHLADPGGTSGFGSAPPDAWGTGGGATAARSALGDAPVAHSAVGDAPVAHSGLGSPAVHQGLGDATPRSGLGDPPHQGIGGPSLGHAEPEQLAPPKGYHNRVDADGDGTWDKATYRGGSDGGADILVDLNHDGKADFVGHDVDADHKVDYADYDKDHDGVFEKRMYDDNNDGWLDRTVWKHPRT